MKFHEYVQLREGAGDHIFADTATVFHHRDKARGNPFTLEIPEKRIGRTSMIVSVNQPSETNGYEYDIHTQSGSIYTIKDFVVPLHGEFDIESLFEKFNLKPVPGSMYDRFLKQQKAEEAPSTDTSAQSTPLGENESKRIIIREFQQLIKKLIDNKDSIMEKYASNPAIASWMENFLSNTAIVSKKFKEQVISNNYPEKLKIHIKNLEEAKQSDENMIGYLYNVVQNFRTKPY